MTQVTSNLAETSVVKSQLSVLHRANLLTLKLVAMATSFE